MGSSAISPSWRPSSEARTVRAKLLLDEDHYTGLIMKAVADARVSVWISTANLKTMLIEAPIGSRARARGQYISFFESLGDLAKRGLDIRILHAGAPSGPLAREMNRLAAGTASSATTRIKLRRCPRVHLKMIVVDGRLLYLGSANLTGAGLGAKSDGRRNFEMGIVTDNEGMLDIAQERFDRIWRGAECASCKLRSECDAPLDMPASADRPSGVRLKVLSSSGKPKSRAKTKPGLKRAQSNAPSLDVARLIAVAKQITPPRRR